ncbi:MAG: hypothetical protein KJ000_12515 [Pirellulaceae bacterium]|nr:hypothetical protein [Pirellulaceae bacterium]
MTSPFADQTAATGEVRSPKGEFLEGPGPQPPRLQIIHLLLWTAGTAVVLGAWRGQLNVPVDFGLIRVLVIIQFFTLAPLLGAGVASLGVWAYRASRGIPFPFQPGHWVLVTLGLETVLRAGAFTVWRGLFGESIFNSADIRFVVWAITRSSISLIGAGLFLTAAVRVRAGLPWKFFLGGQAAHASVNSLIWAVRAFIRSWWPQRALFAEGAVACVCIVLLFVAAAGDRRQRTHRDWMHWLGVITGLAAMLTHVAWIVIVQFL